jgi:hypothetical protein
MLIAPSARKIKRVGNIPWIITAGGHFICADKTQSQKTLDAIKYIIGRLFELCENEAITKSSLPFD